jgi:hypothetical protein
MSRFSLSVPMMSLLVVLASGCAPASGATETGSTARRSTSSSVITAEEIAGVEVSTAFDIVQKLRPQFLRGRGSTSTRSGAPEGTGTAGAPATTATQVRVYVDGALAGDVEALRRIAANSVRDIRYLSAADATTRYGTGHPVGVIEVRTR